MDSGRVPRLSNIVSDGAKIQHLAFNMQGLTPRLISLLSPKSQAPARRVKQVPSDAKPWNAMKHDERQRKRKEPKVGDGQILTLAEAATVTSWLHGPPWLSASGSHPGLAMAQARPGTSNPRLALSESEEARIPVLLTDYSVGSEANQDE